MNDQRTNFASNTPRRVVPAAMIGALVLGSGAFAGTMHVPGDYATIQAAIDASVNGDEIVLADGTYTGTGNKDLAFGGRGITLRSENGPAACVIDVQGSGVGLDLTAADGSGLQIEGLTLTDSVGDGAGLRCAGASPTVTGCIFDGFYGFSYGSPASAVVHNGGAPSFIDCTFRNNTSEDCWSGGGAISSIDGTLTVLGCHFESNTARGETCAGIAVAEGGAISAINGTVSIQDSTFDANRAFAYGSEFGSSHGGAILLENCDGTIERCTFGGNVADPFGFDTDAQGGALHLRDAPAVVVRDCVFSDNVAGTANAAAGGAVWSNEGNDLVRCSFTGNSVRSFSDLFNGGPGNGAGGAAWFGAWDGESESSLVNCRFEQNAAECTSDCSLGGSFVGGAVAIMSGAEVSLVNCLLAGNAAYSNGAGLYVAGAAEMINCTITDNDDPVGDGPVHTAAGGSTTVSNAIIRTAESAGLVGPGPIDVAYSNVTGGAAGTGNIDLDPDFADVANGDYRLAAGSPSIDTGNAALLPADDLDLDDDGDVAEPLPVDIRDFARVIAADVDMGAYETTCAADFDGDGGVGFTDLTSLLGAWGPCPGCPQDLDGDDLVGFTDLTELLSVWGPC